MFLINWEYKFMAKKSVRKVGRPRNLPAPREMLKSVIPIDDIFEDDEKQIYNTLVEIYLKDFDVEDLTSGDIDDIMSLAMNRVLEIRLLKTSKGDPDKQIDVSTAIEKLRKQNDKIKDSLSSRRKDRIDPNEYKGFSIVDLAIAYEEDRKKDLMQKALKNKKEENEVLEEYKKFPGNRYDLDVMVEDNQEDY